MTLINEPPLSLSRSEADKYALLASKEENLKGEEDLHSFIQSKGWSADDPGVSAYITDRTIAMLMGPSKEEIRARKVS